MSKRAGVVDVLGSKEHEPVGHVLLESGKIRVLLRRLWAAADELDELVAHVALPQSQVHGPVPVAEAEEDLINFLLLS